MFISERGYIPLSKHERLGKPSFFAISRSEIKKYIKSKKLIILYIVCLIPHFVLFGKFFTFISMSLLEENIRTPKLSSLTSPWDINFYSKTLLEWTFLPFIIFVAATSITAVGKDREAGALELYFSRPINRVQYILGRWLSASFICSLVTSIPVILVWLIGALTYPDWTYFNETLWIPLRVLGQGLFFAAVMGIIVVGISSWGESARTSQTAWIGFLAIMHLVFSSGLRRFLHESWPVYFSPWGIVQRVGEAILGSTPEHDLDINICICGSVFMVCLAFLVVLKKLRPLEIVG